MGVVRPGGCGETNRQPGFIEEAYSDLLRTGEGRISAYAVFTIADRPPHQRQHPLPRTQLKDPGLAAVVASRSRAVGYLT